MIIIKKNVKNKQNKKKYIMKKKLLKVNEFNKIYKDVIKTNKDTLMYIDEDERLYIEMDITSMDPLIEKYINNNRYIENGYIAFVYKLPKGRRRRGYNTKTYDNLFQDDIVLHPQINTYKDNMIILNNINVVNNSLTNDVKKGVMIDIIFNKYKTTGFIIFKIV